MSHPSKTAAKIDKALKRVDKISTMLHTEFPLPDREVQPIINELLKVSMMLQNLKHSKKGGDKNNMS